MLINLYAAQIVIILAAAGALIGALPEARCRPMRPWQLLLTPALAGLSAFVAVIYPSLKELEQPEMWELAVICGVVGLVRGQFMPLDVDQIWNVLRLRRLREGMWVAIALLLFAIVGAAEAILVGPVRDPENPGFRLLFEIGMTSAAGFLIGRAGTLWFRIPHVPHQELVEPDA